MGLGYPTQNNMEPHLGPFQNGQWPLLCSLSGSRLGSGDCAGLRVCGPGFVVYFGAYGVEFSICRKTSKRLRRHERNSGMPLAVQDPCLVVFV